MTEIFFAFGSSRIYVGYFSKQTCKQTILSPWNVSFDDAIYFANLKDKEKIKTRPASCFVRHADHTADWSALSHSWPRGNYGKRMSAPRMRTNSRSRHVGRQHIISLPFIYVPGIRPAAAAALGRQACCRKNEDTFSLLMIGVASQHANLLADWWNDRFKVKIRIEGFKALNIVITSVGSAA